LDGKTVANCEPFGSDIGQFDRTIFDQSVEPLIRSYEE
jgi:hypothetical protein